jgi:ubiquinone/menaquinone biosynthesis C-methylase UbiE
VIRLKQFVEYWEKSLPWSFLKENLSYEEKRCFRYSLQDYMLQAIGFDKYKDKLVLEIGCGGGIDSAEFGRSGAKIVSTDFTEKGVKLTRDLLREADVSPNVIRTALQNLPFPDNLFDCVYAFGVLHHMPEVEYGLREIARVLKIDGEVICMLYNKNSILYAYSILFLHKNEGLNEEQLLCRYSERNLNCPYTKAYTKEEAYRLFQEQFHDIDVKVFYNVIDLIGKRKFKLDIPDEYNLGWHIIIKGRKVGIGEDR